MEIRKLTKDDYIPWEDVRSYSFSYTRRIDSLDEKYLYLNPEQAFGVFVNNKLAAGGYRFHMKQNIRGNIVDMGGISAVASAPEYRRQGYVRQIMDAHFVEMNRLGQYVSVVYPFKPEFYEHMGYAIIAINVNIELPINKLRSYRQKIEYERLDRLEGGIHLRNFHRKEIVPKYHGMIDRSDSRWTRKDEKAPGVVMLARINDELVAAGAYTISGYGGMMESGEYFWTSVQGREAALGWAARHIDQVKTFRLHLPPNENTGYWLDDFRGRIQMNETSGFAMGRIVNLEVLNGLPVPVGSDSKSIRIVDEQCQWNNKTIQLSEIDGKLVVEDTTDKGAQVSIQAVAAAVYGAVGPGELVNKGWATEDGEKILLDFFPQYEAYVWDVF
ncbi:MAG: GNAT family N-acetyltransferase [Candidatus Kariarchaeaceae archaeon]|jgi:predicted acetyltransferase